MKRRNYIFLFSMLFALVVHAQDNADLSTKPKKDYVALTQATINETEFVRAVGQSMGDQMIRILILKENQPVSEQDATTIYKEIDRLIKEKYQHLETSIARGYSAMYTEKEAKEIRKFLETKTGQAYNENHQQVLSMISQLSAKWAQSLASELKQRLSAKGIDASYDSGARLTQ